MQVISGIVKQTDSDTGLCKIKVLRPRSTSQSALPSLLVYSRCGRIPPTMIKDCAVLFALSGRTKAYFIGRIEGDNLVLVQESQNDDW